MNVAETDTGVVVTEKLQAPVPVQAPPQPVNMEPAVADCDKVMLVGFVYVAVQVPEVAPPVDVQLMFVWTGLLVPVTVPEPAPGMVTVTSVAEAKVALTLTGDVPIVKLQSPVPGQLTLVLAHPTNVDPAGAACNVTVLPGLMALLLVHVPEVVPAVEVQLMPKPVVSVTVPVPLPAPVTDTVVALKAALTD